MKVVTVDPYRNHLSDDRNRYTHEAAFDASTGDLVYLRMYRPDWNSTTSFQDFYCCGADYPSSIYWGAAVHLDCAWNAYYY